MKIGIIREGKNPPDKRVALSPKQCVVVTQLFPEIDLVIQPSPIRAFVDSEYESQGLSLQEDLSDCDVLIGVKEVPLDMLIPHKTYLFFSHTYKMQPYNSKLLSSLLDKNIRLIDYEMLTRPNGKRVIGFGRYAGIVGAYNAFRAWGEQSGDYTLKAAHACFDRKEMEQELTKVKLANNIKIALTGDGRVAHGSMEILQALKMRKVSAADYLSSDFDEPVYSQLLVDDYFKKTDGSSFKRSEFYNDASGFESNFGPFAQQTDLFIASHFWSEKSPFLFTRDDAKSSNFKIRLISDISCDIDGPVASTLRPSTIAQPFYGYDTVNEAEVPFGTQGSIGVSAVDNLPCELPKDASEDFGNEMIKNVLPHFFNGDKDEVLARATETTLAGELTAKYAYLADYANGRL